MRASKTTVSQPPRKSQKYKKPREANPGTPWAAGALI